MGGKLSLSHVIVLAVVAQLIAIGAGLRLRRTTCMTSALLELVKSQPRLISVPTEAALQQLYAAAGDENDSNLVIARLVLRKQVWALRRKAQDLGSYTAEKSGAALSRFQLPAELAARCGLPETSGQTWYDAVEELKRQMEGEPPVRLWERVETHPICEYVPMQCQSCGRQVPDLHPSPEDPNLTEEPPTPEELPYVRAGWFRGPRGPVVMVFKCPDCGSVSRWFRSLHPEVTLNPNRWGRLCGEQEDLKTWLARYLGVRLRLCCPQDWDHIWTEVWDGSEWRPLDPNCINFARRLHEGIGSWTGVLAVGTPMSGGNSAAEVTEDVTETYIARAKGTPEEEAAWRSQISAACADATGASTQARTLCGYIFQRAGLDETGITAELRAAQQDFDAGRQWYELESDSAAEPPPSS